MFKKKRGNAAAELNVINFGLAFGVTTSLGFLLLGLAAWLFGFGTTAVELTSRFYSGYEANFIGSIVGAIWGFFEGFIAGVAVAWFYNLFNNINA